MCECVRVIIVMWGRSLLIKISPRLAYSLLSFAAGIYALLLVGTIMSSVGDVDREFRLMFWFPWQLVFLVVLVADNNPHDYHLYNVAQRSQILIRFVGCVCLAGESVGFMSWMAYSWSHLVNQHKTVPQFLIAGVFLLAAQSAIGLIMCYIATAAVFSPMPHHFMVSSVSTPPSSWEEETSSSSSSSLTQRTPLRAQSVPTRSIDEPNEDDANF